MNAVEGFDINDAMLQLAAFAYNNCLHLVVQLGLTGNITPIQHSAKRRLRTLLQKIMDRAAKFVAHACRLELYFGRGGCGARCGIPRVQECLWAATG